MDVFRLAERDSSVGTEVRAGTVTFLTMAYILAVNSQILATTGMPIEDVVFATAVSAALGTALMGLWTNYPFALAPGMGLNAYFAFGVVAGLGVSWQTALTAVFIEGLLFIALSATGARRMVLEAIPLSLKIATTGGIGLFLAFIGFQNAGLIEADPATLVRLDDVTRPGALLALGGLLLIGALWTLRIKGAILIGIIVATGVAWLIGMAPLPDRLTALPQWPRETFLAFEWGDIATGALIPVVLAFFFTDLLGATGSLIGMGRLGGFMDETGNLPKADRAFMSDAVGTTVGAMLGTSTVNTYIESATGIEEGGRTGLTALVVAGLFLLALPLTPLLVAIPAEATAPALIVVGTLMLKGLPDIDWADFSEALPAFLTLTLMPFTFSIANGIAAGFISWVALRLLTGRFRDIRPMTIILTAALMFYYVLLSG